MGKVRGSNFERETELENQMENEGRIDGRELCMHNGRDRETAIKRA